jgi:ribulose-phosphate 3-epimerase
MRHNAPSPTESAASIRVSPSILSADLGHLEMQIKEAEQGGANEIHIDVMDGHFVPNITFGLPVVEAVRKITNLPIDVHLMVHEPEAILEPLVKLGADIIDIHIEACADPDRLVSLVHGMGAQIGVAMNPTTGIEKVNSLLSQVDRILVMSVHPGFPAQEFLPSALPKLQATHNSNLTHGYNLDIAVDGGISPKTSNSVARVGAKILIAGSSVFASSLSIKDAIANIRQFAQQGLEESQ